MDKTSLRLKATDAWIKHKSRLIVPVILYVAFYLAAFCVLESMPVDRYYYLFSNIDRQIPFVKIFVLPYLAWFIWIPLVTVYFWLTDEESFRWLRRLLICGMTVFLAVSALFPTKLYLRPFVLPDDGLLCRLIGMVYRHDTPTNVFPSIHVYNTCVVWYFVNTAKDGFLRRRWVQNLNTFMAISICLSTVLIKQHSLFDVFGGIGMCAVFIYGMHAMEDRKVQRLAAERKRIGTY